MPPTLGLVLAGGLARRMGGGDKPRTTLGGIDHPRPRAGAAAAAMHAVIINANGDPARFADTGLPVVADDVPDFAGPLAGILAGLDWAAAHAPDVAYVASVPGDCPFLPRDLVAPLAPGAAGGRACRWPAPAPASGGIRWSALWPVALRGDLRQAVTKEGLRKIEMWTARHGVALADWPVEPVDPFFNVNTPEDAAEADRIAAQYPA